MTIDNEYYQHIKICSNNFYNVKRPIVINNKEPFIMRRGLVPLVWLHAAITPSNWLVVVESNVSLKKEISVAVDAGAGTVSIIFLGLQIMSCHYSMDRILHVDRLNLKILGFDIIGNEDVLVVGKTKLSGYTFEGAADGFVFDTSTIAESHQIVTGNMTSSF